MQSKIKQQIPQVSSSVGQLVIKILDLNISNYEINTLKYNEIHNLNHKSPKSRLDFKSRQPKLLVSDPSAYI